MTPNWIHAAAWLAAATLGGSAAAERFETGPADFAASLEEPVVGPALPSREAYRLGTGGTAPMLEARHRIAGQSRDSWRRLRSAVQSIEKVPPDPDYLIFRFALLT